MGVRTARALRLLTPDLQLILGPAGNSEEDMVWVAGLCLVLHCDGSLKPGHLEQKHMNRIAILALSSPLAEWLPLLQLAFRQGPT